MKKLTEQDFAALIGTENNGYTITKARPKGGKYSDSDCYGIALGSDSSGTLWVTWEFKIEDGKPEFYWGHYNDNTESALNDYEMRN
jgi:hypothetical protein